MRFYADYIRGPIHVKEPYEFDKRFFGIEYLGKRLTPNEWWQLHTNGLLDFFTGLAYIIFIPVFLLTAAYYRFWLSRVGTPRFSPEEVLYLSKQILWAFFWVNMVGYSTYYWYAASPPWYAALYGFGPARTDIPANLAGYIHFNNLLRYHVFQQWYGRSADVHGAIPSLHIAYPLQTIYYAFKFKKLKLITVSFYLLMCFSAVYLNHHYVLDVIWGSVYALATCLVVDMIWSKSIKRINPNAARISLGLPAQRFP
jgi:membrane-associated phospholipid phosphatase